MKHVTLCVAMLLFMLIAACAAAPSGTNGPAAQGTSPQAQPPAPQRPADTSDSAAETSVPNGLHTHGDLWVRILAPQDGSVVKTSTVKVTGQAPAETVLTVNDEIVLVSQDQTFEQEVTLQKGSNLIEILASDTSGNEVYVPITVDYRP